MTAPHGAPLPTARRRSLVALTPSADLPALLASLEPLVGPMGLDVQGVSSAAELERRCEVFSPAAVLVHETLWTPGLLNWLQNRCERQPSLCAAVLLAGSAPTRLSTATADGVARIAINHLADALPALLTFEMTRRGRSG